MARRDLTALAALGTLGYMLSKKGDKKKDADKPNVYDVEDARKVEAAPEEDPEEAANRRVERTLVNPNAKEFGEPGTSETVTPTKKPAVKRTSRPAASTPSAPKLGQYVPRDTYVRSGQQSFDTETEPSEIMANRYRDYGMNRSDANRTYKRGGKVKKMASGGMASSASKRADGIASRGKTKCKMY